jgi:hypothetical protein
VKRSRDHTVSVATGILPRPTLTDIAFDSSRIITVFATNGKTDADLKISYTNMKVVGQGRYGTVFSAKMCGGATLREQGQKEGADDALDEEDSEIAIKKYLQDKRFKVSLEDKIHHKTLAEGPEYRVGDYEKA